MRNTHREEKEDRIDSLVSHDGICSRIFFDDADLIRCGQNKKKRRKKELLPGPNPAKDGSESDFEVMLL